MWTEIALDKTPEEFQQHINEYMSTRDGSELLEVIEATKDDGETYKYIAFMIWGNMCTVISMWADEVLHGKFNQDSMIIGEMKRFINHPKIAFWF